MTPVLLFVDLVAKVSNSGVKCPLTDSPGPVKSKRPTPDNQLGMSRVNKQTVNVHTHYIRCEHCSPEWLPPTGEKAGNLIYTAGVRGGTNTTILVRGVRGLGRGEGSLD